MKCFLLIFTHKKTKTATWCFSAQLKQLIPKNNPSAQWRCKWLVKTWENRPSSQSNPSAQTVNTGYGFTPSNYRREVISISIIQQNRISWMLINNTTTTCRYVLQYLTSMACIKNTTQSEKNITWTFQKPVFTIFSSAPKRHSTCTVDAE